MRFIEVIKTKCIFFILIFSLSLEWEKPCWAVQKRSLLIMISMYPTASGWPTLNAHNDQQILDQTLKNQGFKNVILANQEATAAQIRKAFSHLVNTSQKGDKIVVAFSGHGQQVQDYNGDESDKLDEAIVAYDAPRKADPHIYHGEKHIIDDEIGIFVQQLSLKIGLQGQLLLLLDCCHSGTGARTSSSAQVRGGAPPITSDNDAFLPTLIEGSGFNDEYFGTRALEAPFVVLTGAAASQQNYEVKNEAGVFYGALSYSFCEALHQARKKDTYRILFTKITNILAQKAPFQTPTIEGSIEAEVFAGDFIVKTNSLEILAEQTERYSRKVRVAVGELAGVFTDAVFQFVPQTKARSDTVKPLFSGKVIKTNAFSAVIQLDKDVPVATLQQLRAEPVEKALGKKSIGVFIDSSVEINIKHGIENQLLNYPLLQISERQQAIYCVSQHSQWLSVRHSDTQIQIDSLRIGIDTDRDCVEFLVALAQAEILREINLDNPIGHVSVGLQQLSVGNQTTLPHIKINTPTTLTVNNLGDKPVFVAIADIQPNGVVQVILPDIARGVPQLLLMPQQTRSFVIKVSPPLGMEMYKIFISTNFLDLPTLIGTRGESPYLHPLNQLFQRTFRGQAPKPFVTNDIAISSLAFLIVP